MKELTNLICKNIAFPFCTFLATTPSPYKARTSQIFSLYISNPCTLILLLIGSFCCIRVIYNAKKLYPNLGRKELVFFFYMYLCALLIDILLISELINMKLINLLLCCLQLSFVNTISLSLVLGEILSYRLIFNSNHSLPMLRSICSLNFVICFILYFVFLTFQIDILFISLVFMLNLILILLFCMVQTQRLRFLNKDIWSYWTLVLSIMCGGFGVLPIFLGSGFIFSLSDAYLDSIFFFHLCMLCAVLMKHKLWYSMSDTEEECLIIEG
ncbi:Chitin synthase export chaperone [Cucumispora dikerogammari]|nr:Chitin synthase export chaperone [Cucumispora dikerogammari]